MRGYFKFAGTSIKNSDFCRLKRGFYYERLAKIDKNFIINTNIEKEGLKFYSIEEKPFKIYGVFKENGKYIRMPERDAKAVSENVGILNYQTSGGRVRFITDSPYVAINIKMNDVGKASHFPLTGSAGLDLYVKENGKDIYRGTFIPPYDVDKSFEGVIEFKKTFTSEPIRAEREITINFPTYSGVDDLYIGLDGNSYVKEAPDYKYKKPIVYYGHSITQGGCVSRPGCTYPAMVSRRFDSDFLNLGFSGSAKGEVEIAEYIAGLDMEVFVYDYENNAPNPEHLRETHERMFKIIREKNPDLPIIIMTATPRLQTGGKLEERQEVIYATYKNAKDAGDENVYFVNGWDNFDECRDGVYGSTVEGTHLSDLGFSYIAKSVGDMMEKILK